MIKLANSSQWKLNKLLTRDTSIPTIKEVNCYIGKVVSNRVTSTSDKYMSRHKVGITVDIDNITAASMTRQVRLNFSASQVMAQSFNPVDQEQGNTELSYKDGNFVLELFSRYGNYTLNKLYGYYIWLSSGISISVFDENGNASAPDLNGSLCFVNGGFESNYPNRVFISILVPRFLDKLLTLS